MHLDPFGTAPVEVLGFCVAHKARAGLSHIVQLGPRGIDWSMIVAGVWGVFFVQSWTEKQISGGLATVLLLVKSARLQRVVQSYFQLHLLLHQGPRVRKVDDPTDDHSFTFVGSGDKPTTFTSFHQKQSLGGGRVSKSVPKWSVFYLGPEWFYI